MENLHQILATSASTSAGRVAVRDTRGRSFTYADLQEYSNQFSIELAKHRLSYGERVGIVSYKTIESLASIFAILQAGATYVPVDPDSPAERNIYILSDCSVKLVIAQRDCVQKLASDKFQPEVLTRLTEDLLLLKGPGFDLQPEMPSGDSLAYILYTSGSTGQPKGVMYSHRSAMKFVDWSLQTFAFDSPQVFSSHAPFHFDLSVFDIYVCFKQGGTLILIDEQTGKQPLLLSEWIAENEISVWYSTPTVLTLLVQYGKLEQRDFSSLKFVLFAGEVFPVKYLRALKSIWKMPRFFNLYGPTETNVCTFYEIPAKVPEDRSVPYPIGKPCSHLTCEAFTEDFRRTEDGEEGELFVTGPIMTGYWNQPEKNNAVFSVDSEGKTWYRTGDIVQRLATGDFVYVGRRDRMVKRRGYRVELDEIEAGLYKHPAVIGAAVIARTDNDGGSLIHAFVHMSDEKHASIIQMKQFCYEHLPAYMIPDRFIFVSAIPKTSTEKTDYQKLLTY